VTIYRDRSIRYLGEAIAAGPDGALWFTMYDEEAMYNGDPRASGIGRITTAGKVTVFRGRTIEGPGGITAGRDGALWFTMFNYKWPYAGIGRITPNGSVTATSLNAGEVGGGGPSFGITVGPDRAIWFRHPRVDFDSIGRISTAGEVKMFRDRRIRGGLSDSMTSGPDGALWFTNDSSIGRITTGGVVSVYKDMSIKPSHEIAGIATGPDKAIWFTNPSGKSIGRLRIVSTS
jgi:virginiamycin B lyase